MTLAAKTVSRMDSFDNGYFFFRAYRDPQHEDPARLNLNQFKDPFDVDAMHPGQREYFRFIHKLRDLANDPARLADFYADLIATAHRDFHFNTVEKIRTGVEMYSALLQDLGFARGSSKDLTSHIKSNRAGAHLIVVVGCQDAPLLEARAKAAAFVFKCCTDASCEAVILAFSGKHPPEDNVAILNEAADLKDKFEASLSGLEDQKYSDAYYMLQKAGRVISESESNNTRQNIEMLFKSISGQSLFSDGAERKLDVFLVSNDFHLVRISKDFRAIRHELVADHFFTTNKLILNRLNLIGAENFQPERVEESLKHREYSKRFYFEALSHFFRRNYFLDDRVLLAQLPSVPRFKFLGKTVPAAFVSDCPFSGEGKDTQINLRLNEAILFPVDKPSFLKWLKEFFLGANDISLKKEATPEAEVRLARMRLLHRLGGRNTQPTVRIAGEIKTHQHQGRKIVDLTLATNFDGVSFAAQFNLLSTVNPELAELARIYNLVSLGVIASYLYRDGENKMLLFHRRSPIKYTFPGCWDCAVEGPIYKDDLQNRAMLNPTAIAERLFQKEHIEFVERTTRPTFQFKVFAVSFDRDSKQAYIQGLLEGPKFIGGKIDGPSNSLVDAHIVCEATPNGVAKLLKDPEKKWNPSSIYNILYTLESLGFSKDGVTDAFTAAGLQLSNLRGELTI